MKASTSVKNKRKRESFIVLFLVFIFISIAFLLQDNVENIFNFFYTKFSPDNPLISIVSDTGIALLVLGLLFGIPCVAGIFLSKTRSYKIRFCWATLVSVLLIFSGFTNTTVFTDSEIKIYKSYNILSPDIITYDEVGYVFISTEAVQRRRGRRDGRLICNIRTNFVLGIRNEKQHTWEVPETKQKIALSLYDHFKGKNMPIDAISDFRCDRFYEDSDIEMYNTRVMHFVPTR